MRAAIAVMSGVLVVVGVAALAEPESGLGHLGVRSVSPGHLLRPTVTMPATETMAPGAWGLRLGVSWGNVWLRDTNAYHYIVDAEWIVLEPTVSYAVSSCLALNAGIPVIGRSGGILDRSIESFHNAFAMENADREYYPRDQVNVRVTNDRDETLVEDGDSWGMGDIPIFLTLRICDQAGARPKIISQVGVTLPTGNEDELEGLGAPLWGGSLLATHSLGPRWNVYGGASLSYTAADESMGVRLRHEEVGFLGGLRYLVRRDTALLGQFLATSPVAEDYAAFADWTQEVHVGIKKRIGPRTQIEISALENVFTYGNSADFGLHFAIETVR